MQARCARAPLHGRHDLRADLPIDSWDSARIWCGDMLLARLTGGRTRRPMLLALVFGFVLVLVGVTASALVAVASEHLRSSTLRRRRQARRVAGRAVRERQPALDATWTRMARAPARAAELGGLLASLTGDDEILRIEIRSARRPRPGQRRRRRGGRGRPAVRRDGGGARRAAERDRGGGPGRDRVGRPDRRHERPPGVPPDRRGRRPRRSRSWPCGAMPRRSWRAWMRRDATS